MKTRSPLVALPASVLACALAAVASIGHAGETAQTVVINPLPPLANTGTASPDTAALSPAPAASGTVPLVASERLAPMLPPPPKGWGAETPQGSTTDTDELRLSTAQRSYFKSDGDDQPTASITIIDFAKNQGYVDAITAAWQLKADTAEGYDRPVQIDGMRGFEHYAKLAQACSLTVVVAGRFYIQVELTKVDPKDLRDWFKRIDIAKLAELK